MKESAKPIKIEISHKTIIFFTIFLIGLWLVFQILDIIITVFLALIFLSALLKPVQWLTSKKIPRILSIIIVYAILIIIFSAIVGIIVPPLISQTSEFVNKFPQIVSTADNFLLFHRIPVENLSNIIANQTNKLTGDIIGITRGFFSSIVLVITLFVLTFYFLLEWKNFMRIVASPFSGSQEKRIINIIIRVEDGLGRWLRGQLMLSIIVGILTYIGLFLVGIPFALPLALVAAVLEIIPIMGPVIASIPAILVGFTVSPFLGFAAAAVFIIVQQLENHLIVPMVMSRVVGVQPPIIIISLLIGAKLAGIGGAFLAVPLIIVIKIVAKELLSVDQKFEEDLLEQ